MDSLGTTSLTRCLSPLHDIPVLDEKCTTPNVSQQVNSFPHFPHSSGRDRFSFRTGGYTVTVSVPSIRLGVGVFYQTIIFNSWYLRAMWDWNHVLLMPRSRLPNPKMNSLCTQMPQQPTTRRRRQKRIHSFRSYCCNFCHCWTGSTETSQWCEFASLLGGSRRRYQ